MERFVRGWVVAGLLLGTMTYAIAEDVTLTTYYPSPRGVYNELRTNSNTFLALQGGGVGIGALSASRKLDVTGSAIIRGNAEVTGTLTVPSGGGVVVASGAPANGKVLTAKNSSGDVEWRDVVYAP